MPLARSRPPAHQTRLSIPIFILIVFSAALAPMRAFAGSTPEISNVMASQRMDGSFIVDIYYDLSGAASTVGIEATDSGGPPFDTPITDVSGDVGPGITPGTGKHIIWNSGTDLPGALASVVVRLCIDVTTAPGMAIVPGGEYLMGNHFGGASADELPVHAVNIDTFYIDVYEVTNQQYADALNWALGHGGLIAVTSNVVHKAGDSATGYCDTTTSNSQSRITFSGGVFGVVAGKESHPMVLVSWYGAAAYSNWRSEIDGLTPSYNTSTWACNFAASGYRLPTEAEWEKAARGGLHTPYRIYPWGDLITGANANYLSSGDPFQPMTDPDTTPVGYYNGSQVPAGVDMANGYGLYDVAGNVWEWNNDWYGSSYYSASPYPDPQGPASSSFRVLRGGSWNNTILNLRCSQRNGSTPGFRYSNYGFRLALD